MRGRATPQGSHSNALRVVALRSLRLSPPAMTDSTSSVPLSFRLNAQLVATNTVNGSVQVAFRTRPA
jgi:hypothetical protein